MAKAENVFVMHSLWSGYDFPLLELLKCVKFVVNVLFELLFRQEIKGLHCHCSHGF